MASTNENEQFLALSVALTGYSRVDLQGTGLVDEYWRELVSSAGKETSGQLLDAWEQAQGATDDLDSALRRAILSDSKLGPVARNVIKMWYLGQWADERVVSGEAYQQGLVWDAIGAHPMAAKQQGFGVWSLPPRGASEDCR